MTDSGLLTPAEIEDLTGKRRHKAQQRALKRMGIRHVVRPNGSVVVARALVAQLLARYTEPDAAPAPERRVDWSYLRKQKAKA